MTVPDEASFRPAHRVGWVVDASPVAETPTTVYVARFPDGPPLVLEGTSSLIWEALEGGATTEETIALLSRGTDTDVDVVSPAVRGFVELLLTEGLIEPRVDD